MGVCRKGFTSCRNGVRTQCLNQVIDSPEQCNGLDDDCDGKTDEGVKNACGTCGADRVPQEDCVVRGREAAPRATA